MIKRKNIIKVAIDSPAAAGAGTIAKAISKNYNLFHLDTGKIYRLIALYKISCSEESSTFGSRPPCNTTFNRFSLAQSGSIS